MTATDETGSSELSIVSQWDSGLTWLARPDERMRRTSHAITVGEDVWLVDPVDAPRLDESLAELGTVAGVVVLASNHGRDADRVADRHDAPVFVPAWFDTDDVSLDASVRTFADDLADTGFELRRLLDGFVQEGALYHPDRRTLVVSDLLTRVHVARGERLAVFPFYRLSPPREQLGDVPVDRVLVGHGGGIYEGAQAALDEALAGSRRRAPSAFARNARSLFGIVLGELTG